MLLRAKGIIIECNMQRLSAPSILLGLWLLNDIHRDDNVESHALICGKLKLISRPTRNRAGGDESERKMQNVGINRNAVSTSLA